jgi:hypothetical protein
LLHFFTICFPLSHLVQLVIFRCSLFHFGICYNLLQLVRVCYRLWTLGYNLLPFVALYYLLQFVAVCYSLLQFVTVCYSLLQFVTVVTIGYNLLLFVTICDEASTQKVPKGTRSPRKTKLTVHMKSYNVKVASEIAPSLFQKRRRHTA